MRVLWRTGLLLLLISRVLLIGETAVAQEGDFEMDFESFEEVGGDEFATDDAVAKEVEPWNHQGLRVAVGALLATLLAGVLVRYERARQWRTLLLLTSLITLGFWLGGCPCPISSFQNTILRGLGGEGCWYSMVWFLGLIPITYLFGKVWCGWICHLGALQEFLHASNRLAFLRGERAQQVMRWMRYVLFAALLLQLFITRENLFIHVDPFKVAFNMRSFYATGWILLGLLLVSSLYIYRPFCRSVCPVGLVLGWVSRLPGALRLAANDDCRSCRRCASACQVQAIDGDIQVKNGDCIMCGTCLDSCKWEGIGRTRGARSVEMKTELVAVEK
ncbi:MAG: 4Fe-4S binding protein [Gemmatimonadetes bacterium]|jgi:hypothetical protein|nr:4Fe-4S binding protein [Gemmatimonadota bacterium]